MQPSVLNKRMMRMLGIRRLLCTFVAVMHICMISLVSVSMPASAQSADAGPPSIDFERIDRGVAGDTQVFSATVEDDQEVAAVTLHYRFGGAAAYDQLPMKSLAGTSIYTASVNTVDASEPVLQYYIEARDLVGNRSIQGFAFDPLERVLLASDEVGSPTAIPATAPVAATGLSNSRKILYTVLGVLAVGALAAAAGGSGGGSENPSADDPGTIPLTIVVDPL